jgi:large subunit ribosomal protein L20
MSGLKKAQVTLDRKILSELAMHQPAAFTQLVLMAKTKLAA